jgi:hypothetical protein
MRNSFCSKTTQNKSFGSFATVLAGSRSEIIVFAFSQRFWQNECAMQKVGYIWLKEQYGVEALDYWITSYVQGKGSARTVEREGYVKEIYRSTAWPGDDWSAHLEFALKKEGLHLELIKKLMPMLPKKEVLDYVTSVPTGRHRRVVWYLYESFTGERLEIDDLQRVNYVPLADPKVYLTGEARKVSRQRVDDNLLGGVMYCAFIRKRGLDYHGQNEYLMEQCVKVIGSFPDSVYQRAVSYLYFKESKSSYAIERETPTAERSRAFVSLLEQAGREDFLNKQALVELQNMIVDRRFSNDGYRDLIGEQIYVGESLAPGRERIHYIGPKPEDVPALMELFIATGRKLVDDVTLPDIAVAAVVSYLFNFIHPFSDGNGRIHRFLIHHVLAIRKFGQEGVILPVSAVILNRPQDYDQSLESFSKRLVDKISYEMDDRLRMTVHGETIDHYRYIDCTKLVEIFYDFVRETIETELPAEADYLLRYDSARKEMRGIVDLPDRIAELFIKCCLQNGGVLSKKKQKLEEFEELTSEEIGALESIITELFPELVS